MEFKPDSAINFFSGASVALKNLITKLGSEFLMQPGEVLMEQGDEGDTFYVVLSGALEISVMSSDGRKLSLNVAHKGDVIGEIALFDPGPRTATVRARERSRIRGVKNADVMNALVRSPELMAELIRLAGRRLRWMGHQLSEQVFLPLPARLARKIQHLTAHNMDARPVLPLSQMELAEFTGASREAVSKTLAGWSREGHVKMTRGALQVLNRDAMEKIAEFSLF